MRTIRRPPGVVRRNDSGLIFENDSGFSVATAGQVSTGAGRSFTYQLAHLSELAFWKNASDHLTAVLDAVPGAEGSEIVIESTASGAAGPFFDMAMAARLGRNDYRLVFMPWFDHDEYRATPPDGWTPGDVIRQMGEQYALDREQMYWAERTNREKASIDGDAPDELSWRFRQEYPANIDEAFRAGRTGGFIAASVVARARQRANPHQADAPLIIGCDFATGGGGGGDNEAPRAGADDVFGSEDGDSNVFMSRRGRAMGRELYDRFKDRDSVSVANRLQAAHHPACSPTGCSWTRAAAAPRSTTFSPIAAMGVCSSWWISGPARARPISASTATAAPRCTASFRDWLQDGDIPDDDLLEAEITSVWVAREDEQGLVLAAKREVRKEAAEG